MKVAGCAGDGRAAVELARTLQPDIVLMDISMPELNGLLAAQRGNRRQADFLKKLNLKSRRDIIRYAIL